MQNGNIEISIAYKIISLTSLIFIVPYILSFSLVDKLDGL